MKVDGYKLAANVELVVLPTCSYCKKLAPKCECGYPHWKKASGS